MSEISQVGIYYNVVGTVLYCNVDTVWPVFLFLRRNWKFRSLRLKLLATS